jgi:hypothetical protein
VALVARAFIPAIPVFEVLAVDLFVLSVAVFPSLVLDSAVVNKQTRHLLIWVVALGVNAVANAIALLAGGGPLVVAWNDIWIQAIVVLVVFETALPHIGGGRVRWGFYAPVAVVAFVMAAVGLALHAADADSASVASFAVHAAVRTAAVTVVWTLLAVTVRRQVRTPT